MHMRTWNRRLYLQACQFNKPVGLWHTMLLVPPMGDLLQLQQCHLTCARRSLLAIKTPRTGPKSFWTLRNYIIYRILDDIVRTCSYITFYWLSRLIDMILYLNQCDFNEAHLQNLPPLCPESRTAQNTSGTRPAIRRPSPVRWLKAKFGRNFHLQSLVVGYGEKFPRWTLSLALQRWHCWTSLRIHLSKAIKSDSLPALVQLCYGGTMQSGQCLWSRFSIISRQGLLGCKHWTQLADSVRPCTMRYVKFGEYLAMNWC